MDIQIYLSDLPQTSIIIWHPEFSVTKVHDSIPEQKCSTAPINYNGRLSNVQDKTFSLVR